jgi:hypothetical protein
MISIPTARQLRDNGVRWTPETGDRFVVADRAMDEDVFVLSEMTVEVHQFPHGPVIGFNGTTEWALDSVEHDEALWLPREDQLRALLGGAFRRLDRATDGRWQVNLSVNGREWTVTHREAEEAYALALLSLVTGD